MPGCYHQKALDIKSTPTLPKHIMLYRARGVEEMEEEEDNSDSSEQMGESDKEEDYESNNLNEAMTSHGDL